MFTKIDRVQVEKSITEASELRNQPSQQTMTLGTPSREIFLPVLSKIGSQNDCIQDNNPSPLSPSPDGTSLMAEADLTSSGKKVRFSQPLEFWKEFDRDSGQLLDENGNSEDSVGEIDENTKENERKLYEEKVGKKLSERREKRRGKTRIARTITEAVENLQLEDEKTSVRKFIAHYKRSTARDIRLQNKPTQRRIVCEHSEENPPTNDVISDSHQHDNNPLCKLCKLSRKNLALHRKAKRNSESCAKKLSLKQKTRASSLPSLDGRKLFEERLLPDDDKCTLQKHVKYGCYGAVFRGGTSVSYLTPTPLIVQLFE